MKSLDEIKKGLEICSCDDGRNKCVRCPYFDGTCQNDLNAIEKDALALIQQLQADKIGLLESSHEIRKDMLARINQLEAELKDEKNNHQHTIEIAKRQKEQIKKLKNVIVRLNNERAHRDDECGHAGPGIRDNY